MAHRKMCWFTVSILGCLILGPVRAQQAEPEIQALLQTGVQQFESGEVDAARATFESVLERDPGNYLAIYELALTHAQMRDIEGALAILDDGFERGLDNGAEFYSLAAALLDQAGRPEEAMTRFEQGIAAYPDNHNLHLNFGITQFRLGQAADARETFQQTIELQPEHPSAHYFLGAIYAAEGQAAAAMLALGTSIGFDSNAQRMAAAAQTIKQLMESTASFADDGTLIIMADVSSSLPVESMDLLSTRIPMLYGGLLAALLKTDDDTSYKPYAMAFNSLISTFIEADIDRDSHFAAARYADFFGPMVEEGHQQVFAHIVLASLNTEVAGEWLQANSEKFDAFREWTRGRQSF